MANPPAPTQAAPPQTADDDGTPGAADAGATPGADDAEQPVVICTVLGFPDGTFGIVTGDESETQPAEGDEGQANAPEKFPSKGEALKAVMEEMTNFEQSTGAGEEAQGAAADQQLQQGFDQG